MPRSGINGTYTLPGTQASVVPGTTISSSVNNQGYSDIEQTFNTIQPEAYGGTGASTYAQARTNLGVLSGPVSAMSSRRNLWVNGSFKDSQENGNTLGTTNGYYPADQVSLFFAAATAAMSVQRIQVRTLANATDQIEFKTTTAKAVLGANDFVTLTQPIEGSSIADAGWGTATAKPIVLRFQVSLPAGAYHVHVNNAAANRNISVPFVVAGGEANTAVVKTVTIPGDTTGTWLTADGVIGATFDIVLAAGTSLTGGTAGVWGASYLIAASAQFNILSSTANVARLADIGAKVDADATGVYGAWLPSEVDAVYRSLRYVQLFDSAAGGAYPTGGASAIALSGVNFSVVMCKTPSFSLGSLLFSLNASGDGFSNPTPRGVVYSVNQGPSVGSFNAARASNVAFSRLA